eukprot:13384939-Alexandrium_andersonii.AAC.1
MSTCQAQDTPPFTQIRGWRVELNLRDDMHAVFLGLARDVIGPAVWSALEGGLLGQGSYNKARA